jgi:hypothetical protein
MAKVRLLDDQGKTAHDFEVPSELDREIGRAGDLTFRGRSYRYTALSRGRFVFEPSGNTFLLKEEWLKEKVD